MRDWIQIQRGILDFKKVKELKDKEYIRALTLCLLHSKEFYIDGINILFCFKQDVEMELISYLVPDITKHAAIEQTNFGINLIGEKNTVMTQWLADNLYSAFLDLGSPSHKRHCNLLIYSPQVDYNIISKYHRDCEEHDTFNNFQSTNNLWMYVQAKTYIDCLVSCIKSKGRTSLPIDVSKLDAMLIMNYGFEPFLRLIPQEKRDISVVKSIIDDASVEEKPYLISSYESAWAKDGKPFVISFDVDNVAEAIKISDYQRRKNGIMAPSHIDHQQLHRSICDIGAEATLKWVLKEAEKTFPVCNNACLAISQEPVWSTPLCYLHFINDNGQTFVLTDDDIKTGFNPFTRNLITGDIKLHGHTCTYVELWSRILNRVLSVNS